MSKKRDIFKVLDNYMTSDSASKVVKEYIDSLTSRIQEPKKK